MSDETLEKKDKLKLVISKIKENYKLFISGFLIIIIIFIILAYLDNRRVKQDILISKEFNTAKILIQNQKNKKVLLF